MPAVDRISTLPDDVIHHILSFSNIKYAIQTSVLSKRWEHIYKSLPYLHVDDDVDGILDLDGYYGMAMNRLTNRDSESFVSAVSLRYDSKFDDLVKSKSLKSLCFIQSNGYIKCQTSDWYIPALVSLHLERAALGNEGSAGKGGNIDLFSRFENLKHLKLIDCIIENLSEIETFCPRLESLTLVNTFKLVFPAPNHSIGIIWFKTSDWYLPALVSLHLELAKYEGSDGSGGNVDLLSRFQNLKHLKLISCIIANPSEIETFGPRLESLTLVNTYKFVVPINLSKGYINFKTSNWYLPALVSLHLKQAELSNEGSAGKGGNVDLFSRFENLKHLKLIDCVIENPSEIEIFSSRLESLTLVNTSKSVHSAPNFSTGYYIKCKTSVWYLPSLISLHLEGAALGDVDLFSRFENLKHLKLINCIIDLNL